MAIQQYILLPQGGIRGDADAVELLRSFPEAVSTAPSKLAKFSVGPGSEASIKIVDSMGGDGPKLVEMDTAAGESLNSNDAIPLRAVPVVMYAAPDGDGLPERQTKTTAAPTIELHCTRSDNGAAIAGARVLATFPDGSVESGRTDSSGKILVPARTSSIEQLIVVTGPDLWGACRTKISIELGHPVRVEIDPVVLPYKDAIARYYSKSTFLPATGVVVGVIDTGIGPHSDLNIASSCNTVTGEPASDSGDWKGHGTHVAGLIGASPSGVSRMRGLAPGVPIRSYRVFGNAAAGATNYAILKAMILAEQEGCDVVNLSLGGGPQDRIVEESIRDARDRGMLVIIAAGNNRRQPISYPAAYSGATAVTALGVEGTFPKGAVFEGDSLRPPSSGGFPNEFIAGFSNFGQKVACAGLGVGVISTLPHGRYGPSSGTSMAAPVVAGAAACLLSRNKHIYEMPRNRDRSDAMEKMLLSACVQRGFGQEYEGFGIPDPAKLGEWPATF